MIKQYLFQAFLIAILAVHLIVLYDTLEKESITVWYSGLLMFHTPVWMIFIIIGEILIKFKINYRLLIISSSFMILIQLIVVHQKLLINFDFLALYYVINYIFCFSLFANWREKTNRKKQIENQKT